VQLAVGVNWQARYLYAANAASNNISGYRIDASTGALMAVAGSPFAAGSRPSSLAVPQVQPFSFLFVTNAGANNVSAYRVDDSTGVPTLLTSYAVGNNPSAVAVAPSANMVFVANSGSDNLSAFSLDMQSGVLAEMNGSPFSVGSAPKALSAVQTPK
jgi:6-phosphogluconolactonase (cycloisomerase 2 family)